MWWLYLDESGDLGFDFENKQPSKYFTICILATSNPETNRTFRYAVTKTLKRKVNRRRKHPAAELHAHSTTRSVKEYTCDLIKDHRYGVYALTLNKRGALPYLTQDKAHVYNFVARNLIDRIPFERADGNVILSVDRSKGSAQRREFNEYLSAQLEGRLDPKVRLSIIHEPSEKSPGLQLVDMFAWSIHRKYEQNDDTYVSLFKEKLNCDEQYQ